METKSGPSVSRVSCFSEKQFQCGASIAALRLADAVSRRGAVVHYNFDQRRPGAPVADAFASIAFERTGATDHQSFSYSLRSAIAKQSATVAHFHNYFGDHQTILTIAERTPLIWTMHDTAAITGYHYRTADLLGDPLEYRSNLPPAPEWYWNALRHKPFALTAPSKWLASYARASAPDHIIVRHIPNVVSPNQFFPMDRGMARAIVGLPQNATLVLFFAGKGAWKRKNFEVVARALQSTPELALQIIVVGGAADRDLLRDPRFIFMNGFDPVSDAGKITALYNAADAFCISSLIDNLPNTVLEAIACGRPVIAAATGGIIDMVKDAKNGWLFEPKDPQSVAAAFKRFLADRDNWPAMSAFSRRLASSEFGEDAVAAKFLDLYREFEERGRALKAAASASGSAAAPDGVIGSTVP